MKKRARLLVEVLSNPVVIIGFCYIGLLGIFKKDMRRKGRSRRKKTYLLGFAPWKTYLEGCFPDRKLIFLPQKASLGVFISEVGIKSLIKKDFDVFKWGFQVDDGIERATRVLNISSFRVEDGFIRSVGLGSTHTPSFSLTVDSRTAYFDSSQASDLECILNGYDFEGDPDLMERSRGLMERLVSSGLSKYNLPSNVDIENIYGEKFGKRVLVVGQVEDDASIAYGSKKPYNNNDAVMIAAMENPDAQIIYKPHPDVLHGHRAALSNPDEVRGIATVLDDLSIPLSEAFKTVDHVYTITSQAGMEALMRGIKVTTLGAPFYSGWGLTDDRQPVSRRQRKLSLEEVFAGSYLLYPIYYDPINKERVPAEKAFELLFKIKSMSENYDGDYLEDLEAAHVEEAVGQGGVFEKFLELKAEVLAIESRMIESFSYREK